MKLFKTNIILWIPSFIFATNEYQVDNWKTQGKQSLSINHTLIFSTRLLSIWFNYYIIPSDPKVNVKETRPQSKNSGV